MTKKGSLSAALGQFDRRASVPEASPPVTVPLAPTAPERPARVAAVPAAKTATPPSRQGKKALTGYFAPEVIKQLKAMSVAEETTIQSLLSEALNDLFKKHGKPHIA